MKINRGIPSNFNCVDVVSLWGERICFSPHDLIFQYSLLGQPNSYNYLHHHDFNFYRKIVLVCIGIFEFFHCGLSSESQGF